MAIVGLAGSACRGTETSPPREVVRVEPVETEVFTDRARELGIDFVHDNGMSGDFYFIEVVGSGTALVDYDRDGDLDVYLVQGQTLGAAGIVADEPLRDRLFRNELVESGRLRFVDATDESGIRSTGYGMGVAAGDYDGDGWIDLYVTNFGPNLLLRNRGDGTFVDVTERAGVNDDRWSTSAAFYDYDRDGHLDLFVTSYVDFALHRNKECYSVTSARDYCGPRSYKPIPDRLYHNRGDGTFEDVTAVAGIAAAYGAGLGVVFSDLTGDGEADIYVANDGYANQFWVNQGDGTFVDDALIAGCAVNEDGEAEAGMGVDAGDFDGDGDDDLFMTHLTDETNTLYRNDGTGLFDDVTIETSLSTPSTSYTGFGTAWFDYDNDGLLDLFVTNGEVKTIMELARRNDPYPLHQPDQLFRNLGGGRFEETTRHAGAAFAVSDVGRGAAFGDIDNDGDTDVVVANNNGQAHLLVNQVGTRHHWLGLRATGPDGVADRIGTRVEVVRADGSSVWRTVRTAASYCSSSDPRVLLGLGAAAEVGAVRAHWTDGTVEEWTGVAVDAYTTLRKGSGHALPR
jgi:hypothetical protein